MVFHPAKTGARFLGILGLALFFSSASLSGAATLAVFPFQDLSSGANGINFELTELVAEELQNKGFEIISPATMMSFMARNRIRTAGSLETYHIYKTKDELGASLIFLGTICQLEQQPAAAIGLTGSLIRTDNGQTIWANTMEISRADVHRLLGLAEPDSISELIPLATSNLLATWPNNLDLFISQRPVIDLQTVELGPKHLQPGEPVQCTVRLRSLWGAGGEPRIFFKVGSRLHSTDRDPEGRQFAAVWDSGAEDGRYPVTMVLTWPDGRQESMLLGSYFVDSQPPLISLDLKGARLHGSTAFRDELLIIPRQLRREPIERWEISFENSKGEPVLTSHGKGNLPERFFWKGQGASGKPVTEGEYQVVLKVWDRARNVSLSSQQVAVNRTPPDVLMAADDRGRDMVVDLKHQGKVPIAFWRLEMRSPEGELLKMAEGQELPVQIGLPVSEDLRSRKVECVVVLRDILGNQTRKEIKDLFAFSLPPVAASADRDSEIEAKAWVEEF